MIRGKEEGEREREREREREINSRCVSKVIAIALRREKEPRYSSCSDPFLLQMITWSLNTSNTRRCLFLKLGREVRSTISETWALHTSFL